MNTVETERLLLRQWKDADLEPWIALCADENLWRYPFGRGLDREESIAALGRFRTHWNQHGFGLWAVEERATGTLIGFIGLAVPAWLPEVMPSVEVGWRLGTAWWGRGLATEGGRAALSYGFERLDETRILSIADERNTTSIRVMEKIGMTFDRKTVDEKYADLLHIYSIERGDWVAARDSVQPGGG